MKRPKDRLHRVLVIGATPAGIAATNKLGELGIPVTLVDSDPDLDKKLSRDEWRFMSGVALNHAYRPGLIRILRNPDIKCILPAEITSLKHSPQGFRVGMKQAGTFVDAQKCILCGRCVDVCPVSTFNGEKAIRVNSRQSLPGRPVIDKRQQPPCQEKCPLGVNVQGYIALAKAGKFSEALELIRKDNVLPAVCGRICTHPCELDCRRGELDDPIAIRDIKRFITDKEQITPGKQNSSDVDMPAKVRKEEKIAIIGSGPSGLAAAADLARNGYPVTVFDKEKMAGGLLRYGIGSYRLPRDILDRELEYIEKLGVTFKTSHPVDLTRDIKRIKKDFHSVILATGTWSDRMLGVPGEDLEGVEGGLSFLSGFYRDGKRIVKGKTAVIGDGNAAFDLARTLARIGADVTILSWFPKELIPADPDEIKASLEEGIIIRDRTQTIELKGQNGKLSIIRCVVTEPGEPDSQGIPWPVRVQGSEPFELEFNRAFIAIGQKSPLRGDGGGFDFDVTGTGTIVSDENCRTNLSGVYAAGDVVAGPGSVVDAMANGRKVAEAVHRDICKSSGLAVSSESLVLRPKDKGFPEIPESILSVARSAMPEQQPNRRRRDFSEVAMGLSELQVVSETERCLQCGVCSECLQCVDICDTLGAVNHAETEEEIIEHAGVIIIADPEMATSIRGEDVIRAYGPRAAKSDVYAMTVRGYASAAQVMVLLGKTSQRPKGHGISFLPPDQGLSPEIRLGVFVCRCNDSLGWLEGMDEYIDSIKSLPEVVFAETINAACIPEGSSHIVRTIRDKGITRLLLASCVCCPLSFICSSCTDQKSRLKEALFTATGISRSMVETCNMRGDVLRLINDDPATALDKFTGLMDRSMERARRLKALPALARNYNFTTAVIGESESALSSAFTLANAGLEVLLFGAFETPPVHPNIHSFQGALVKDFSGTIGEFQVSFETDDSQQTLQVGAVILGEKARKTVRYIHQEGLPSIKVKSGRQELGVPGIPFFYPGATSIPGLFLTDPPGINVSKRKKGAAAAIQAAALMPRGPRQSKGFTVVTDEMKCRGCGRCINVCPYQAITFSTNEHDGWYASVDEALCEGCGNCIAVCPSSAADSPYRNQGFLERTLEELLAI